VKLDVAVGVYGNLIALPPLLATNQPLNTSPSRVGGVGAVEIAETVKTELDETADPP